MPSVGARAQIPDTPTTPEHLPIARKTLALLKRPMDVSGMAGKEVTVKLLLVRVMDTLTKLNKGREVLILVDVRSFKDREDNFMDKYLGKRLKLPASTEKLTVKDALRLAVAQFPGKDTTYVARREFIEITARVSPSPSTFEPITITSRPLAEALKEVAEKTAIPIRFRRADLEGHKAPVTVRIQPSADLLAVLREMTKKAGLTVSVLEGEFVVSQHK
jgi:hypothetical protein